MNTKEVYKRQGIIGYLIIALFFTLLAIITLIIGSSLGLSDNETMKLTEMIMKYLSLGLFVLFSLPFYIVFIVKICKLRNKDKQEKTSDDTEKNKMPHF